MNSSDVTTLAVDPDNVRSSFVFLSIDPRFDLNQIGDYATSGKITYTPATGFTGTDTFDFKVQDSSGATTDEDTPATITLSAPGVDGNTLTYIYTQPSHGTLTGSGSSLTYTPATNYNGKDSFTFKANDGTADSNIATVSITVNAVNDAPQVFPIGTSTNQNTPVVIPLRATDPDIVTNADSVTLAITQAPLHGTLSAISSTAVDPSTGLATATVRYTPDPNYNSQLTGPDSFRYIATDKAGTQSNPPAPVTIFVNPG